MMKHLRAAFALLALTLCAPVSAPAVAADKFAQYADNVSNPARAAGTITPSDSTDLADIPKALWIGTGGNVSIIAVDADAAATCASANLFKNAASGSVLPVRARRVCATGTTAADIQALR